MAETDKFPGWHGTTIIGVKKGGKVVVAGDGQVSLGQTVIKGSAINNDGSQKVSFNAPAVDGQAHSPSVKSSKLSSSTFIDTVDPDLNG